MVQNPDEVASTEVIAVVPSGQRMRVRISIERPGKMAHGDWSCRTTGKPLIPFSSKGIYGADSLQTLALPISYLRYQLMDFVSKGGRLLHVGVDGDDDVELDAIFGARRDSAEDPNG